jgi:hypothetical protein
MKPSPFFRLTKKTGTPSSNIRQIRVCSVALPVRPGPLDLKEASPKEKYATLPERQVKSPLQGRKSFHLLVSPDNI